MDITGVMPLPAEIMSSFSADDRAHVKCPAQPVTISGSPGRMWSLSQLETRPPGTRLTVTSSASGRVGVDAMV
jgi:hypothetical protein